MFEFFKRQFIFPALILSGLISCSSKDSNNPPTTAKQNMSSWDHEQIRKAREAEKELTPPEAPEAEDQRSHCVVMSLAEMRRAKAQGCKKLDPRAGNGEDSYCCPTSKKD